MRTVLFWVNVQWVAGISYRLFGITYLPHLQGLNAEDSTNRLSRTLVVNYHYLLCNNPKSAVLKIRHPVYDIVWTQLLCTVNKMCHRHQHRVWRDGHTSNTITALVLERGGCPAPCTGSCIPPKDPIHIVQETRWALLSLPMRSDPRTIQRTAYHYTDYTIPAARNISDKWQLFPCSFNSTTHALAPTATSANTLTWI